MGFGRRASGQSSFIELSNADTCFSVAAFGVSDESRHSGFGVSGFGFRVSGSGFGFRISGFKVSGFGFRLEFG